MSYSKHKDAPPESSTALAKAIFEALGIQPDIEVTERLRGVFSATLTDRAGGWVTCGKGTTEAYCVASACGEAIEHLCNYTAYDLGRISAATNHAFGFFQYPDETNIKIADIPTQLPQVYADLMESYRLLSGNSASPKEIVRLLKQYFGAETLPCVPFYSVKTRKEMLIPNVLLSNLCGSNGGGAGNTPEEAIGHALDEIAERYAKERIYHNGLTPPDVPRSYIQDHAPELLSIIAEIEKSGQFRVFVKDASLGIGLPVLCVLLVDQKNQRYMVNFGAHPCFPIALERCLTEMFQFYESGGAQTRRKRMTTIFPPEEKILHGISNWVSLLKDDVGYLPISFFAGECSWSFLGWDDTPDYTNAKGLQRQLNTLGCLSDDIYIRNNSYFPFCAYRVYIPGVSTTKLPFDEKQLDSFLVSRRLNDYLSKGETLSTLDLTVLRDFVFDPDTFAGSLALHNLDEEHRYILYASLLKDLGDPMRALSILGMFESKHSKCAVLALRLRNQGCTDAVIHRIIDMFYGEADGKFGKCWLLEPTFPHLAKSLFLFGHRAEGSSGDVDHDKAVNTLHRHLKKHMQKTPLSQRDTDLVIYPNQET